MGSLHVPEELGGQGASTREIAVVMEELGRSVAPVPFLGSAVLATTALLGCEPTDAVRELLDALGAGRSVGALAVPLGTAPGSAFPATVPSTRAARCPARSARSPTRSPRTC